MLVRTPVPLFRPIGTSLSAPTSLLYRLPSTGTYPTLPGGPINYPIVGPTVILMSHPNAVLTCNISPTPSCSTRKVSRAGPTLHSFCVFRSIIARFLIAPPSYPYPPPLTIPFIYLMSPSLSSFLPDPYRLPVPPAQQNQDSRVLSSVWSGICVLVREASSPLWLGIMEFNSP